MTQILSSAAAVSLIVLVAIFGYVAIGNPPAGRMDQSPQEIVLNIKGVNTVKVEEESKPDTIHKSMEVSNTFIQLSMIKTNKEKTRGYLQIYSTLTVIDVRHIRNDFNYLAEETNIKDVEVYLNSGGGDAFAGLALYDEIKRAQNKFGFTIHGTTSGVVASAAVPVFAAFSHRIAAPGTIFMVHEAAIWKWPGRETASNIEAQNKMLTMLRKRYLCILAENTKLTAEEWGKLEKQTTWFTADDAKEWGLVDEIE